MIYEIYGAGGNANATYTHDYIVLYNGSDVDVNLDGYSLQYASWAADKAFSGYNDLKGVVKSKGYFLIALDSGSNGEPLPVVVDLVPELAEGQYMINLAGSNGKVALVNGTTQITGPTDESVVDYVAFGTGLPALGSAAAPAPANNTESIRRISLVNTKDNAADFEAKTIDLSYLPLEETFTVKFESNGGTVLEDVKVIKDNQVEDPIVAKEGFLFAGWFTDVELTVEYDFNTNVTTSFTLYAKWDALPEGEVVLIAKSIVDSTTNMEEEVNEAAKANLPADLFDVRGIKGEAGNNVGLSTSDFRLYSVRATGEGNTLSISLDAAYKITSVKFSFSGGGDVTADLSLDGVVQEINAPASGELSFAELSINAFSLKNTHMGGSKNLQIRITEIEITYEKIS